MQYSTTTTGILYGSTRILLLYPPSLSCSFLMTDNRLQQVNFFLLLAMTSTQIHNSGGTFPMVATIHEDSIHTKQMKQGQHRVYRLMKISR